ncbi:MAG: ATP-dependent DNA helicase [Alphaproteobacteria bacterium]|nr:ATP-dependent DNA helicase [Alphaproteobacteria bacterium]NCQ89056.1 ATP-dependent DNA helicase [Alphaproteobacteria bacterium]NCT07956.1 ATP-dependent DNA helicase [Alphaproteobacteria bacterium]
MQNPFESFHAQLLLPNVPSLWVDARQAYLMTVDGELQTLSKDRAAQMVHKKPILACHMPYTCARLGAEDLIGFDILELFAFVHPAKFTVPTPTGLCKSLGLPTPTSTEDYPYTLMECAKALLSDLRQDIWAAKANPLHIAQVMGNQGKGWAWTPFIFEALGEKYDPALPTNSKADLNVWKHLPEWSEEAPPPPPAHHPVTGEEARARLKEILGSGAEARQQQQDYTSKLTAAFAPMDEEGAPNIVLAQAGTGVGKTLGYLAPASVWAEKNNGPVWISTYTKNLQKQVDQELSRVYRNDDLKAQKVAVRKGRENYLCLLNFEEMAAGASLSRYAGQATAAGIMARWVAATKDGDLVSGGDFPGWLIGLLGYSHTAGLSDRRGECIYSACDHYHRCFVEQSVRHSKHADIVVANHALVMIQTAINTMTDDLPKRYVFDEGHHLFDAADSAFAGHLTARETYDLRRWLRGAEASNKSRIRGLKNRAEDLVSGDVAMQADLENVIEAARCLTADGWTKRLKENAPKGPTEEFILTAYEQIMARTDGRHGPYSLETQTYPATDKVLKSASNLHKALKQLKQPMQDLAAKMRKKINEQADTLESDTRKRLDAVQAGLERRAQLSIGAWIGMLESLQTGTAIESFVDWMQIERLDGRTVDIGLYRHWIDPMIPFATAIKPAAHGIVITSATLKDGTEDDTENWRVARERSGVQYLSHHPVQESYASPFDYKTQTKILVINDVRKDDLDQVATAYQTLFESSQGGAIGLFTAISRMKAVHERILNPLSDVNITLYAQHIDEMDTGTLIDIFRDDEHACLLGTDAIRDGVDVPGNALRLIVFDRVPWPRPNILHKARREAFGKKRYDDLLTRLKLKQAYGRLIRRADDKGVFVMMDSMMPSRLSGAFPEGVVIERIGLAEAAQTIREFL